MAPDPTPDAALNAYVRASAAHDLDATMRWVGDDAIYLFSDESSHLGKAAVRAAIARNFETIHDGTYEIHDVRWLVRHAEVAVCVYEYRWSGVIGGERMAGGGRGTNVLRLEGGSWRVVHEHLSRGRLGGTPGPAR